MLFLNKNIRRYVLFGAFLFFVVNLYNCKLLISYFITETRYSDNKPQNENSQTSSHDKKTQLNAPNTHLNNHYTRTAWKKNDI